MNLSALGSGNGLSDRTPKAQHHHYHTPLKMAQMTKNVHMNLQQEHGAPGSPGLCGRKWKMAPLLWKSVWQFPEGVICTHHMTEPFYCPVFAQEKGKHRSSVNAVHTGSQWLYLRRLRTGDNLHVHQQLNGWTNPGLSVKQNITQQ